MGAAFFGHSDGGGGRGEDVIAVEIDGGSGDVVYI